MTTPIVRPAALLIMCLLALAGPGCRGPEDSAPPRPAAATPPSPPVGSFVDMTDANAKAYFVRDIVPDLQANAWRWVNKRPELQFRLTSTQNLKFSMEFAIAGVTLKDTGPIAITYYVNDHMLDKVRYAEPGNMKFEKPVPADWLVKDGPNLVAAEVDKPWISPKDKTKLGFILVRAGFRP